MECNGGHETDNALGNQLGGFCKRMMRVKGGIGKLIKPASKSDDLPPPLQTRDGGCRDTAASQFGQAQYTAFAQ